MIIYMFKWFNPFSRPASDLEKPNTKDPICGQTDKSEQVEITDAQPTILDFPISAILENSNTSVRLLNVAKNQDFPFKTVRDFISSSSPEQEILRLQNAGKKSAAEFMCLMQEFLNNPEINLPSKASDIFEDARSALLESLKVYKFPSCILHSNIMIPVRLQKVLRNMEEDKGSPFSSLADCLQNFTNLERHFKRYPNAGRKSFSELEKAIEVGFKRITQAASIPEEHASDLFLFLLGRNALSGDVVVSLPGYQASLLDLQKTENGEPLLLPEAEIGFEVTAEHLLSTLNEILEERVLEIINRRFGIGNYDCHTLQRVADVCSVTRERVRQLESGAIKRLRKLQSRLFKSYLDERETEILVKLFQDRHFFSDDEVKKRFSALDALENLCVAVAYDEPRLYLKGRCDLYGGYWIASSLATEAKEVLIEKIDCGHKIGNLKVNVSEAIIEMNWPVDVQGLYRKLSAFSRSEIDNCLSEIFKVTIIDGHIIKIEQGINNQDRLNIVLRRAKKALTTCEIKVLHDEMFASEMSEHHIGAVLSSMSEALITGRGTYDIYKNLSFSSVEIEEIRNQCFEYLLEKQKYISAKVIFNDLYDDKKFPEDDFNPHMLLGILQDDTRFDCRRGFMIGIVTEKSNGFVSLTDSLYAIVDLHGPIRSVEIQRYLAKERSVLTVTIDMMLDASADYIKINTATFDRIDRAFGGMDRMQEFRNALEICLSDGPKNIAELVKTLREVEFTLNEVMLSSIVDKWDGFFNKSGLISATKFSDQVDEYNKIFFVVYDEDEPLQRNREELKRALPPALYHLYMIDYRLRENGSRRNWNAGTVDPQNGAVIPIRLSGFKKIIDI